MAKQDRIKIIKDLQNELKSIVKGKDSISSENIPLVLCYITSTRNNLDVPMAMDSIRKIFDHLSLIPYEEKGKKDIYLYLVSNGGDGTVPWRIVTLIREYAKKFHVLIPYRAYSAATLTALGADSIIMHPMGMLGPTDATVANPFNPPDPNNPNNKVGISVEDVTAYISLIKEDVGITHEDELVKAFNKLAEQIHPLALGNVKRSLAQSRLMAHKLLELHMTNPKDQHEIKDIVDNLTSKLYYHGHPINRKEAKDQIGLSTIVIPSQNLENLMWDLYLEYEKEINPEEPFNPTNEFIKQNKSLATNASSEITINSKLAFIESENRTDYLEIEHKILGKKQPEGLFQVISTIQGLEWKLE